MWFIDQSIFVPKNIIIIIIKLGWGGGGDCGSREIHSDTSNAGPIAIDRNL